MPTGVADQPSYICWVARWTSTALCSKKEDGLHEGTENVNGGIENVRTKTPCGVTIEMKNSLDGFNSGAETIEETLSETEGSSIEISKSEKQRKSKWEWTESQSPVALGQCVSRNVTRISEKEETEKEAEKIFEGTMIKIFLHLVKMLYRSMKLNKVPTG